MISLPRSLIWVFFISLEGDLKEGYQLCQFKILFKKAMIYIQIQKSNKRRKFRGKKILKSYFYAY